MKKKEALGSGPVDARVTRSKDAVLATTAELLTESGLGGVSVEEVSKRSGVAKTTIYRHWPSRTALLLDACSKLGARAPSPDTGTFRGDLEVLAGFVAEQLTQARWPSVLPSVVDAAERDADTACIHSNLHSAMISPFKGVVEVAQARGDIRSDLEPTEVVAMILGPLFYRRWFSREPINGQFVENLVESVVRAVGA